MAGLVQIDPISGVVRVDGIPVFRIMAIPGNGIVLQFKDNNKTRSRYRGSEFVEIPIEDFFRQLIQGSA